MTRDISVSEECYRGIRRLKVDMKKDHPTRFLGNEKFFEWSDSRLRRQLGMLLMCKYTEHLPSTCKSVIRSFKEYDAIASETNTVLIGENQHNLLSQIITKCNDVISDAFGKEKEYLERKSSYLKVDDYVRNHCVVKTQIDLAFASKLPELTWARFDVTDLFIALKEKPTDYEYSIMNTVLECMTYDDNKTMRFGLYGEMDLNKIPEVTKFVEEQVARLSKK